MSHVFVLDAKGHLWECKDIPIDAVILPAEPKQYTVFVGS